MQDEIIKSKLALSRSSWKGFASEKRYVDHLTVSKFDKEFVVVTLDILRGELELHLFHGIPASYINQTPTINIFRCRAICIYQVVGNDLKQVGDHIPGKPLHAKNIDYTVEDENFYEGIDSVEVSESEGRYTFKVVVRCKTGGTQEIVM